MGLGRPAYALLVLRRSQSCVVMHVINVDNCELVMAGKEWKLSNPPSSVDMLPELERNECYCTWFQPKNGTIDDQFPAIKIGNHYYSLSIRMLKALFRHIRLNPKFVNREVTPWGRIKLKIPATLLQEKRRTSSRFTVRVPAQPTQRPARPRPTLCVSYHPANSLIKRTYVP